VCVRIGQFGNDFPWLYSVLECTNSVFRYMFQLQPCQHEVKSFSAVRSLESAVGVVTGIGAGMPTEAREYPENRPDPLWGPPSHLFSGYVGSPGVKQLGHEVDHFLVSRLRMSGPIPLLSVYAFMTLTGTTSPSTFFPSTAAPNPTSVITIPFAD
jgi:hypothetical protein